MASEGESVSRRQLFDLLSSKDDDYLYCVVRDWNWSNGTWLLRWIASQPACTRATAQRIFWGCEPEAFLPVGGPPDWIDSDVYELAALVVQNWQAGLYPANPRSRADRLPAFLGGSAGRFRADDGTYYEPGQLGFFDPANPVPALMSYRAAEARCALADLPWTVPDDLGRVQRDRRPGYDAYALTEGVPDEFLDLLDGG